MRDLLKIVLVLIVLFLVGGIAIFEDLYDALVEVPLAIEPYEEEAEEIAFQELDHLLNETGKDLTHPEAKAINNQGKEIIAEFKKLNDD